MCLRKVYTSACVVSSKLLPIDIPSLVASFMLVNSHALARSPVQPVSPQLSPTHQSFYRFQTPIRPLSSLHLPSSSRLPLSSPFLTRHCHSQITGKKCHKIKRRPQRLQKHDLRLLVALPEHEVGQALDTTSADEEVEGGTVGGVGVGGEGGGGDLLGGGM